MWPRPASHGPVTIEVPSGPWRTRDPVATRHDIEATITPARFSRTGRIGPRQLRQRGQCAITNLQPLSIHRPEIAGLHQADRRRIPTTGVRSAIIGRGTTRQSASPRRAVGDADAARPVRRLGCPGGPRRGKPALTPGRAGMEEGGVTVTDPVGVGGRGRYRSKGHPRSVSRETHSTQAEPTLENNT